MPADSHQLRAWLSVAASIGISLGLISETAASVSVSASELQVTTRAGTLAGTQDLEVIAFKGIPYAASPVGALRWMPPAPAAAWSGVRDAKDFAPDCMQKPYAQDAAPLRMIPSEDCLYLNVWRPAHAVNRPVMVWIHGGGFVNGGSSPALYDGAAFARDGVILVSFNYRLGRFGFFGFPALSRASARGALGNYGYLDQIAALKWVQENIAAFGGDPKQVTVFGESAGGGSVHMLLTSPEAKGLFARAIVESGGGRGNLMGPRSLKDDRPGLPSAETIGVNFARSQGINDTGPKGLDALRALSAQVLAEGVILGAPPDSAPPTYSGPVEDGDVVTMSPKIAYEKGAQSKVPIMVGANDLDLGLFFPKTKEEAFASFGELAPAARLAYDPRGSGSIRAIAWEIGMDRMMIEPARFVAREMSRQGLPTYEYRFSYVAPAMEGILAKMGFSQQLPFKGAPHASEIPFVFDTVRAAYGTSTTAQDEDLAKKMHRYWVNFAKAGDPNGAGLPHWPAYDSKADVLLNFLERGPVSMVDPRQSRLDVAAKAAAAAPRPSPAVAK